MWQNDHIFDQMYRHGLCTDINCLLVVVSLPSQTTILPILIIITIKANALVHQADKSQWTKCAWDEI